MDNPFLDRAFHIKWASLTPELVGPAMKQGLQEAGQTLARIAAIPTDQATFENTFLALENATGLLNETWGKVTHLTSVADSPALRAAHNHILPQVTEFFAGIPLNADLWLRLKAAAEHPSSGRLAGEHLRLLGETMADFRQQGADLAVEKKERLAALQGELAQLTQKYSENVLDATNGWELRVDDPARLAGLPAHARDAARQAALKKGLGTEANPVWRFTLHAPSHEPVMLYAEDVGLRRQVWEAAAAVGRVDPHANGDLIVRILALRQEKAALLGKAHFADLVLERRMAGSGQRALDFVDDLHRRIGPAFAAEIQALVQFKAQQTGLAPAPLAPWEVAFWAEKMRRLRYDFDEDLMRPFFPLPNVLAGMFEVTGRVFGIRVTERKGGEVETWHPEVRYYDVRDARDRHIGSFYADWHPRESKRGGAWMSSLITGGMSPGGARLPHLGLMCGNMTPPLDGKPALLSHREVETVFHEFGHLLHHLFGEGEIKSLNGTNVPWDFVELPSQIMENWCWERTGLDLIAHHYQTGETLPAALFDRMIAARNFRTATATMRQLSFGRMDLAMHLGPLADTSAALTARLQEILAGYLVPTEPRTPTIENRFTHLFADPVGYAAGYYSYKWAEVLDADAFTRFQREGIFNPQVGAEFVSKILSRGNTKDPMELYVDFMGRPPDLSALLRRAGLV
jgi:oligopeptidase A